ncbi:putative quinol monooxygenase [Acinetobacter sp. 197]|uniref:putative quinol monooxygenase n=1 Tax=Acinetobacter sp. 197 TaxID=3114696 RepID=UPI003A844699
MLFKFPDPPLVIDAFKVLVNMTRKENGCLQYELHQEIYNPSTLIFFEKWKTMEDLEDHLKTVHFIACFKEIGDLILYNETRILKRIL